MNNHYQRPPCSAFGLVLIASTIVPLIACNGANAPGQISSGQSFNLYTSVVAVDLNGDGALDIATCYSHVSGSPPHSGTVAVFLQDPAHPGKFQARTSYTVGSDPFQIVVADLNGDGHPDLITANTQLGTPGAGSNTISVLLQDPNNPGHFLPATNYASSNVVNAVAVADLNGDGLPDLAIADSSGISFLLQSSSQPGTFVSGNGISIPGGDAFVAISDVNGDGVPDLIAATDTNVEVFLANAAAHGTFAAPDIYTVGQQPIFVAVADLNGDGKPDLAVNDIGPNGGTTTGLHVLLQDTSNPGKFLPATDYSTGNSATMLAIADLNGDGKPDLATVTLGAQAGTIAIFTQSGAGQFQPDGTYPGINDIAWVAIGDIDGDGKPDLVIADGGISVRFQDPANPGKFSPPIIVGTN